MSDYSRDYKIRAIKAHISGLISRLENWISEQKRFMDELIKYGEYINNVDDRLSLLLSAQTMLTYIERILRDFESWLLNPLITSIMPMEILKDLERRLRNLVLEFVKLDIEHTTQYMNMLKKLEAEESVPEILKLILEQKGLLQFGRERERREREMPRVL